MKFIRFAIINNPDFIDIPVPDIKKVCSFDITKSAQNSIYIALNNPNMKAIYIETKSGNDIGFSKDKLDYFCVVEKNKK